MAALPPRAKISEPALVRQYGVSRGPLREALHRLQKRRLITRSPNQGPPIVKPSPAAPAERFIVGEALEGATRLAARIATYAEIASLRAAVAPHSATGDAREAPPFNERHGQDFHFAVAQFTRNPRLIDLLCGEPYPLLGFYRGSPTGVRPRRPRAGIEHERVVSTIEDRDPERTIGRALLWSGTLDLLPWLEARDRPAQGVDPSGRRYW